MRLRLILFVSSAFARVHFHQPVQIKSRQLQRKLEGVFAVYDPGHEINMIRLTKKEPIKVRQKTMTINGMEFYVYD